MKVTKIRYRLHSENLFPPGPGRSGCGFREPVKGSLVSMVQGVPASRSGSEGIVFGDQKRIFGCENRVTRLLSVRVIDLNLLITASGNTLQAPPLACFSCKPSTRAATAMIAGSRIWNRKGLLPGGHQCANVCQSRLRRIHFLCPSLLSLLKPWILPEKSARF